MVPYDFTRKLIEIVGAANTSLILFTADLFDARAHSQWGWSRSGARRQAR